MMSCSQLFVQDGKLPACTARSQWNLMLPFPPILSMHGSWCEIFAHSWLCIWFNHASMHDQHKGALANALGHAQVDSDKWSTWLWTAMLTPTFLQLSFARTCCYDARPLHASQVPQCGDPSTLFRLLESDHLCYMSHCWTALSQKHLQTINSWAPCLRVLGVYFSLTTRRHHLTHRYTLSLGPPSLSLVDLWWSVQFHLFCLACRQQTQILPECFIQLQEPAKEGNWKTAKPKRLNGLNPATSSA